MEDPSNYRRKPSLAAELFREVRPEFFRVLSGVNASVYVDLLDELELEAAEGNEGLDREDVLAIVAEGLACHPEFQLQTDEAAEPGGTLDPVAVQQLAPREKARYVVDYFVRTGWLDAETGADWRRMVFFNPHGATLLAATRRIARPDAAVFTDKLIGVCAALANHAEFHRQPWEHLQTCWDNTQQGLAELRTMRKSVERFIRRQLEAHTLGQNLGLVFDQYSEQLGSTCYAELVRSQLATRLGTAKEHLRGVVEDADLLHRMQAEVLRRQPEIDASAAMSRVRLRLDELGRALDSVIPLADQIDQRTAEFTRRSLARFRYLQEVVGERRGQMQELFEKVNRAYAGSRFSELENLPDLPAPRLPEARLLAGRDSLYEPARRRVIEENAPVTDEITEAQRERTRQQMESALRDSLTVGRANRFLDRLPGGKGARVASADFPVRNEDDLADVMAMLLHAESTEARYRIEVPRVADETPEWAADPKAGCRIERFFAIKK